MLRPRSTWLSCAVAGPGPQTAASRLARNAGLRGSAPLDLGSVRLAGAPVWLGRRYATKLKGTALQKLSDSVGDVVTHRTTLKDKPKPDFVAPAPSESSSTPPNQKAMSPDDEPQGEQSSSKTIRIGKKWPGAPSTRTARSGPSATLPLRTGEAGTRIRESSRQKSLTTESRYRDQKRPSKQADLAVFELEAMLQSIDTAKATKATPSDRKAGDAISADEMRAKEATTQVEAPYMVPWPHHSPTKKSSSKIKGQGKKPRLELKTGDPKPPRAVRKPMQKEALAKARMSGPHVQTVIEAAVGASSSSSTSERDGKAKGASELFDWSHTPDRADILAVEVASPSAVASQNVVDDPLAKLRSFAGKTRIESMSRIWWQHPKLDLDDDTARVLSSAIVRWLERVKHKGLQILYASQRDDDREMYGAVRSMAIECAARHRHKALFHLTLNQLAAGLPGESQDVIVRTKARMRDLQGIKYADLFSADRTTRLGARLAGRWLADVHAVQVMAALMMDQLDSAGILKLFDFKARVRPGLMQRELIDKIVKAAWTGGLVQNRGAVVGRGNKAPKRRYATLLETGKAFAAAMEKVGLALSVYHPTAFVDEMAHLAHACDAKSIAKRYDEVLAGTKGANPLFIVVNDLESDKPLAVASYGQVVVGTSIYHAFVNAFGRIKDVQRIKQLVDDDLPQALRGPVPTPILLRAMRSMAVLTGDAAMKKEHAVTKACMVAWQTIVRQRGEEKTDAALAARLYALSGSRQIEQANQLATQAMSGSLGPCGPLLTTALLHTMHFRHTPATLWKGTLEFLTRVMAAPVVKGTSKPLFGKLSTLSIAQALVNIARIRSRSIKRYSSSHQAPVRILRELAAARQLVSKDVFRAPQLIGATLSLLLSVPNHPVHALQETVRKLLPINMSDAKNGERELASNWRAWSQFAESYLTFCGQTSFTSQSWMSCAVIAELFAEYIRDGQVHGMNPRRVAATYDRLIRTVLAHPAPKDSNGDVELTRMEIIERIASAWPTEVCGPVVMHWWKWIEFMLQPSTISSAQVPTDHWLRYAWSLWTRVRPIAAAEQTGFMTGRVARAFMQHGDAAQSYMEEMIGDALHGRTVPHYSPLWKLWRPDMERMGLGQQFEVYVLDAKKERRRMKKTFDEEPEDVNENILGSVAEQAEQAEAESENPNVEGDRIAEVEDGEPEEEVDVGTVRADLG